METDPGLLALAQALPALRVECPCLASIERIHLGLIGLHNPLCAFCAKDVAHRDACPACSGRTWTPRGGLEAVLDALEGAGFCHVVFDKYKDGWHVTVGKPKSVSVLAVFGGTGPTRMDAVLEAAVAALGLSVEVAG